MISKSDQADARRVDRDGLLEEDVLARLDGRLEVQRPEARGRRQDHHVDAALDHLLVGVEADERVAVVDLVAVPLRELAPARLEPARALLEGALSSMGVSSWNGLLVARAYAGNGQTLQGDLAPLLEFLADRPLPRVWRC